MEGSGAASLEIFPREGNKRPIAKTQELEVAFSGEIGPNDHRYLTDGSKSQILGVRYAFVHEERKHGENRSRPLLLIFNISATVTEHSGVYANNRTHLLKQSLVVVKLATLNPARGDREPSREEKLFKGETFDIDKTGIFFMAPAGAVYRAEPKELAIGVARRIFFGSVDNITESVDMTPTAPDDPVGRDDEDENPNMDKRFAWGGKILAQAIRVITDTKAATATNTFATDELSQLRRYFDDAIIGLHKANLASLSCT